MIKLTFRNAENNQVLSVEYNPYYFVHDMWEDNVYLGKIKLKELFFNGFDCIFREFDLYT